MDTMARKDLVSTLDTSRAAILDRWMREGGVTPSECSEPSLPQLSETARAFSIRFTRWPPEATAVGIERMNRFIAEHGDLTAFHFDGGIP
jgi:hypothetical protein